MLSEAMQAVRTTTIHSDELGGFVERELGAIGAETIEVVVERASKADPLMDAVSKGIADQANSVRSMAQAIQTIGTSSQGAAQQAEEASAATDTLREQASQVDAAVADLTRMA